MELLIELLALLLVSFGINLIPFASPSNLLIASNAALLVNADPVSIGIPVAVGATCAKMIHYIIFFFVGKHVGKERRKRLDATAAKTRRWAVFAVFLAAATPIPDDPVIIPLGLMKYSPIKFAVGYFAGKLSIAVVGAFLGGFGDQILGGYIGQVTLIVISIVLTVFITVILLKVGLSKTAHSALKRLGWIKNNEHTEESARRLSRKCAECLGLEETLLSSSAEHWIR